MSIRYRLKRNNGPLNEPIPAHPDAIYRPQNRPMPENIRLQTTNIIVPHVTDNNAVVVAPLTPSQNGFSPWWIIGPLLGLLAIFALAALVYFMKKKYDSDKRETDDNLDSTEKSTVKNVTLRNMTPNIVSSEQKQTAIISSTTKDASKPKLDINLNKKENQMNNKSQTNDLKKTLDEKLDLTHIDHTDHITPSKVEQGSKQLISSLSSVKNIDLNTPVSPELHGIGKSPLISMFPSGTKRREKQKRETQNDQRKIRNINKDKQQLTLNIDSKYDSLSESSEINSSSSVASAQPTKEKNSKFTLSNEKSNKNILQSSDQYSMINKTDLDKLDNRLQSNIELTTSLTKSNLTTHGKTISLMPNVPQCKGSASSDDNDDDDHVLYTINTNNSTIQQTKSKHRDRKNPNSNLNVNASIYRKKRISLIHKPQTKYSHGKDKILKKSYF